MGLWQSLVYAAPSLAAAVRSARLLSVHSRVSGPTTVRRASSAWTTVIAESTLSET